MSISALADKVILTPYHHDGPGSNGQVTRVVIHATVSPTQTGGAEANAHYFQTPTAGGAAHYVCDPGETVCCVDEDNQAAHAPPNHGSIGIELTDPQSGDPARWADADHQAMLVRAAALTAEICARLLIPLVWRSPEELRAGNWGITSHANVSAAWHQTDHTDPGADFPVDQFMALVTQGDAPVTDEDVHKIVDPIIAALKAIVGNPTNTPAGYTPVNDQLGAVIQAIDAHTGAAGSGDVNVTGTLHLG